MCDVQPTPEASLLAFTKDLNRSCLQCMSAHIGLMATR